MFNVMMFLRYKTIFINDKTVVTLSMLLYAPTVLNILRFNIRTEVSNLTVNLKRECTHEGKTHFVSSPRRESKSCR